MKHLREKNAQLIAFNQIIHLGSTRLTGVEGLIAIEQLCVGTYTIVVSLNDFPQCTTILSKEIIIH